MVNVYLYDYQARGNANRRFDAGKIAWLDRPVPARWQSDSAGRLGIVGPSGRRSIQEAPCLPKRCGAMPPRAAA